MSLLITSPFCPVCYSRGDETDDLNQLTVLVLLAHGVGHQEDDMAIDTPDGLPTLLAVFNALRNGERERIREDPNRGLEAHPVFASVGDGLGWIPFESDLGCPKTPFFGLFLRDFWTPEIVA
jgi:hypothetical protein